MAREEGETRSRVGKSAGEAVDSLWSRGVGGKHAARSLIHGFSHWVRVERNGIYIARQTGVSEAVVSLFALFHDSLRRNDGRDPDHGLRAAELAVSMRSDLSFLDDEEICLRHPGGAGFSFDI